MEVEGGPYPPSLRACVLLTNHIPRLPSLTPLQLPNESHLEQCLTLFLLLDPRCVSLFLCL